MMYDKNKFSNGKWMWWILLIPVLVVAGIYVFGNVVMFLWNYIMPSVFGLGTVTFWQALAILILAKILFGGLKGSWGKHHCCGGHKGKGRWMNMSEEEKEKFKEEWKKRCSL